MPPPENELPPAREHHFDPKMAKTHAPAIPPLKSTSCNRPPPPGTLRGAQYPFQNDTEIRASKRGAKSALGGSMGRHRESPEAKKMPIREPKGCHKRVKNCDFSGPSRKTRNLTKIHYLLCFRHISHPRKRLFLAFFGIQNRGRNQESTKCPNKCS